MDDRDIEIERLRQENARLRAENGQLRPLVSDLTHRLAMLSRARLTSEQPAELHPHDLPSRKHA